MKTLPSELQADAHGLRSPPYTMEANMPERYTVHFNGPNTSITEHPDGPWPRWEMAKAACCIEHLEDQVRECLETVMCLRRAGSFTEYRVLVEEMGAGEAGESAD